MALQRPLDGLKVLLLEDEPASLAALTALLRLRGAEVRGARAAEEALAAFPEFRPDVLVSDLTLPDMDGFTLLGRIRASERESGSAPTPALALTGIADPEHLRRALEAGFERCLSKPAPIQALVDAIRAALPPSPSD